MANTDLDYDDPLHQGTYQDSAVPHRGLLAVEIGLVLLTVLLYAAWMFPLPFVALIFVAPAAVILGLVGMYLDRDSPAWWAWLACTVAPVAATGLWWYLMDLAWEGG